MTQPDTKVDQAIREIEQVEYELSASDGMEDQRESLTEARADLVDALLEQELSDQSSQRIFETYFIASLLAFVAITMSFGGAVLINIGANPPVGRALGAAWAWAVGIASGIWFIPWVKQGIPSVDGGCGDE